LAPKRLSLRIWRSASSKVERALRLIKERRSSVNQPLPRWFEARQLRGKKRALEPKLLFDVAPSKWFFAAYRRRVRDDRISKESQSECLEVIERFGLDLLASGCDSLWETPSQLFKARAKAITPTAWSTVRLKAGYQLDRHCTVPVVQCVIRDSRQHPPIGECLLDDTESLCFSDKLL
jgi:hypothetical protein